jgi:hypothetical protein
VDAVPCLNNLSHNRLLGGDVPPSAGHHITHHHNNSDRKVVTASITTTFCGILAKERRMCACCRERERMESTDRAGNPSVLCFMCFTFVSLGQNMPTAMQRLLLPVYVLSYISSCLYGTPHPFGDPKRN